MLIEIRDLTYTYPEETTPALDQLHLEIDAGQLVLLQGNSGSGKSTLIGSINGLVPHFYGGRFAGHVMVDGMDTRHAHPGELASRVGTVFQEPESRFVTSSVLEEIVFGLEATGLSAAGMRRRVDDITHRLNLGALANRPLDKLSGGEQQRVALAVAMGRQPKVLLLDEPTSQLDRPTAEAVLGWLAELHESLGLTTLVAEHRLEGLVGMASRRLTLNNGKLAELRADPLSLDGEALDDRQVLRTGGPPVGDDGKGSKPAPVPNRSSRAGNQGLPSRLSVKGLEAGYDHLSVLSDVCLDVFPGEIVALVGRNGSGKTTLLRSLMGLLPVRAGEVWLDAARVDGRRVAEVARRMAYVPQWPGTLLFADTVRDELTLTLRHHGLAHDPPLLPEELLSELNLDRVAAHYPRDLSAGERQRAAIAAVIVTRPALLLLDEPTLGMDATVQESLGGLLHRLRKDGMSVLIATHDQSFARRFSDRVVALEGGRIVQEDSLAETPMPSLHELQSKKPLQAQQGAHPLPARRPHA